MKKKRYTTEQIISILEKAELDKAALKDLIRGRRLGQRAAHPLRQWPRFRRTRAR